MRQPLRITKKEAESLAIQAFAFIAEDGERIAAFLAETGVVPETIRDAARDRSFLLGVLDHLAHNEALLLAFTREAGIDPLSVGLARTALGGPRE
jgi:hypothetical protein